MLNTKYSNEKQKRWNSEKLRKKEIKINLWLRKYLFKNNWKTLTNDYYKIVMVEENCI